MSPSSSFRHYHLIKILEAFEQQAHPLDLFIQHYFRAHHAIGSKDRLWISDTLYALMRYKRLLKDQGPAAAVENWNNLDLQQVPFEASLPQEAFDLLQWMPHEALQSLCLAMYERAPTTLRANTLKITRDQLLTQLGAHFPVQAGKYSPTALHVMARRNLHGMQEFKEGLFEIQDEGSQLLAELVRPQSTDRVLDYCAGSGGKSLAMGARMKNQGSLFLHDSRPYVLKEAAKRLQRAGITNAHFGRNNSWYNSMDWVLVDAPCTGSGTWRRSPDAKWRWSKEMLNRLIIQQRAVFQEALLYLKRQGFIVYATCSLFQEENQMQAAFFQREFGVRMVEQEFQSWPHSEGAQSLAMDGFYGVVFQKE